MPEAYQFKFYHPLFLLVFPLMGTFLSSQVNWTWFDYLVMAGLLLGLGIGAHFILKRFHKSPKKWSYLFALILVFILIWAELAVGIFGSPIAGH
ncbi:hypothetical protein N9W69_01420 [Flavobacteriaceae bacterium]|nr:hypothetical protein [Flavobacteriaceae bacterium]